MYGKERWALYGFDMLKYEMCIGSNGDVEITAAELISFEIRVEL